MDAGAEIRLGRVQEGYFTGLTTGVATGTHNSRIGRGVDGSTPGWRSGHKNHAGGQRPCAGLAQYRTILPQAKAHIDDLCTLCNSPIQGCGDL